MALIEILPDVFYDSDLPWYEQDPQLIELAETVMQTAPIDSVTETAGANSRMIWGEWQTTTSEGTFTMRVDMHYLFPIDRNNFMSKALQDTVLVTQIL